MKKTVKSGQLVTDLERFVAEFKASDDLHTTVALNESGKLEVRKRTGTCMLSMLGGGSGAPTVDPATLPAKADKAGLPWSDDYADRWVPYWGSDERVDSHGDIVVQEWLFDEFATNPVMPFCHQWGGLPVGNCIDWQVLMRSDADYNGNALWLLGIFATADQYDFADSVFNLVRARFLRAGSVGFTPDEIIDIQDEAERNRLGLRRYGRMYRKNHLFEFSPCLLGANAGALTLLAAAKRKGKLRDRDLNVVRELARAEALLRKSDRDKWRAVDAKYIAMAKTLFPRARFERHDDIEQPFEEVVGDALACTRAQDDSEAEDSIERRVERIETLVEEGFTSITAQLEDMRSLIETNAAANADDGDADEDEVEEDARGESAKRKASKKLDAVLARVGPKLDATLARRNGRATKTESQTQ